MDSVDLAFEALGVPDRCRYCPIVGTCVVEYSASLSLEEELSDDAMSGSLLDRQAELLAKAANISIDEAKKFVNEQSGAIRQEVASILDENDASRANPEETTARLIEGCPGAELVDASTGRAFACRSPYIEVWPNDVAHS